MYLRKVRICGLWRNYATKQASSRDLWRLSCSWSLLSNCLLKNLVSTFQLLGSRLKYQKLGEGGQWIWLKPNVGYYMTASQNVKTSISQYVNMHKCYRGLGSQQL